MVTANQKSTIDTHTKRKSNPNRTLKIVNKSQVNNKGMKKKGLQKQILNNFFKWQKEHTY